MNENSAFQNQPTYVGKTSNKKRLIIIFFVVLLLVIAGLGGLYYLGNTKKETPKPTAPIPTQIPVATVTPEASPSGSLTGTPAATTSANAQSSKTFKISVFNGSGTAGAAQQIASSLKKAGYTNVTIGNADAFTYTGVTIHVKKAQSEYLKVLQKEIAATSPSVKITSGIDDTIPTDAEVIVGQ